MTGEQIDGASGDMVARLLSIVTALSAERDLYRLLETILLSAKKLTHADGGTLFLAIEQGTLETRMLHTSSRGFAMGGTTGTPVRFDPLTLANARLAACASATQGRIVRVADVYDEASYDFVGSRAFGAANGQRTKSLLCTRMRNLARETISVIQIVNATDSVTGAVVAFSHASTALAQSLASQGAVAIENRRLIDQLTGLFEAIIEMINGAIDEKSSYTGGHCKRVPELTMMFAEAAAATREGPLAGFAMSEADRCELRIAGLLHDRGKVTTPVHVVDKATKLETIFDRIAVADTRFEVLRRDIEIAALRGEIDGVARDAALANLGEDQAFLRKANIGGERMSDADIERVRAIAERRWRPAEGVEQPFLSNEEVENLTIVADTLTSAERDVINHHVVATINMLDALPWPKHLRRVPEFAGGHHERMDGKSYPKGLMREQMSLQARMMAISDIFETLTAAEPPYKPAKPLSESLHILGKFALNGHIDPDLLEQFVREKVYLRYAEAFLPPKQADPIDEASIPGYPVVPAA